MRDRIQDYMTPSVTTIQVEQTLSDAHAIMNTERIRHLPVVDGDTLVGMLSQRDLHLLETLEGVNPDEVRVEEAMSEDVYVVPPTAPLKEVVSEMATHKRGSVVVVESGELRGIFTTVDALKALRELLEERA